MYTYLLLNIFSIAFPLAFSFENRVKFYKKWKGLFLGILITGAVFIIWDIWFTANGIWGFNDRYLSGWTIINLPVEEWLFFIFIPYACLFIYEASKYYIRKDYLGRVARPMVFVIALIILVAGFFHLDRQYTGFTFLACGGFLIVHVFFIKAAWLGRFLIGYALSLIPFLLVNGWLTGGFTAEPVVWYNDAENLGIRIGSIPLEDSVYLLLLLLGVTTIYENVNSAENKMQQAS